MMKTTELDMAIDQANWIVRRLSEAHGHRWNSAHVHADKAERSARNSLDDLAQSMGYRIVAIGAEEVA
jgi:hypothetical protein